MPPGLHLKAGAVSKDFTKNTNKIKSTKANKTICNCIKKENTKQKTQVTENYYTYLISLMILCCKFNLTTAPGCRVQVHVMYCTSQIEASTPPPPGNPRAFVFFAQFLFKFPPPEAEKLFKCPIIGPFQVIKCPNPRETFR